MKQGMNQGEKKTCCRADGCGQNFTHIHRMGGNWIYLCRLVAQSWLWPSSPRAIEVDPETKSTSAFGGGWSMQKDRWMNVHSMVIVVRPLRGDGGGWVLSDATTPPSQKTFCHCCGRVSFYCICCCFSSSPQTSTWQAMQARFPSLFPSVGVGQVVFYWGEMQGMAKRNYIIPRDLKEIVSSRKRKCNGKCDLGLCLWGCAGN